MVPTQGDVFINKVNTKEKSKSFYIKQKVGMVFQNPDNQIVESIVDDEIAFGLENICTPRSEIKHKIENALEIVGLKGFENRATYSLSGGQKQRLAIASIIAMSPDAIVLDEPTSMLDPEGRQTIIKLILKLNKEFGITIILITHFIEEALMADRIIKMVNNSIKLYNKPKEIFLDEKFINSFEYSAPDSTKILYALKNKNFDVSLQAFKPEECANEILKLLEKTK